MSILQFDWSAYRIFHLALSTDFLERVLARYAGFYKTISRLSGLASITIVKNRKVRSRYAQLNLEYWDENEQDSHSNLTLWKAYNDQSMEKYAHGNQLEVKLAQLI